MNELDFGFEIKQIDEAGYIEGVAAGYGNVDHGNDRIIGGAASKSVAGRSKLPMLLYHNQTRPIGAWAKFAEESEGLAVEGRIAMKTRAGQEAHALAEAGALPGLSIGYSARKHRMVGKVRELLEIDLHEVSLVAIPMNDRAVIRGVKDILSGGELPTVRQFEDFLRDAGGFSKSLAAAIAAKATPHLRGDPESKADELVEFLKGIAA